MDIDFEKLINLQKLDEEIRKIIQRLEYIPLQITEIDKKIKKLSQIVTLAKEKLSENQKKRRSMESDVQAIKAKMSRYKQQLNNIKSNLEYKSLLKEIDDAEQKINSLEDEIINEMVSADDIKEEIKEAKQEEETSKSKYLDKVKKLDSEKKDLEEGRNKLTQEKKDLFPKIPSEQTDLYMTIFGKKNGIALSPVTDDFCSLCQIRIRPQVLNELKAKSQIILCENCARILYWKEN